MSRLVTVASAVQRTATMQLEWTPLGAAEVACSNCRDWRRRPLLGQTGDIPSSFLSPLLSFSYFLELPFYLPLSRSLHPSLRPRRCRSAPARPAGRSALVAAQMTPIYLGSIRRGDGRDAAAAVTGAGAGITPEPGTRGHMGC